MAHRTPLRIITVIPCRNDANFLRVCLQALADQSRPSDEVIVVDNASTDDTALVAKEFGAHLVREDTVGVGAAAARGYDEASSRGADIIARVDADSIPPTDWIQRVDDAFGPRPSLDALTGIAYFYGCSPLKRWLGEHMYVGLMKPVLTPILGRPALFGSNMAMRTALWDSLSDAVDRTNPNVHDDLDLSLRMPGSTRVVADQTLIMPVSGRPFDTWQSIGLRLKKAFVTFRNTWPMWIPWVSRTDKR